MRKVRALILFSGGLDSILAAKILMEQGVECEGLCFKSCFFDGKQAKKAAKQLGIKLRIVDFSKEHLKIVKCPKYGDGRNMNPCIDCHLLMLKFAKKIAQKENFDFTATGEVLGERPMSQNKGVMELIKKKSGIDGTLLRPLSAKLLEPTEVEKKRLINREELLDIKGRSRKKQMELAKRWNIREYPTPAGGCLLTDPEFSKRLKELLYRYPKATESDIELLKFGRHFWFSSPRSGRSKIKIIVGRNHEENLKIKKLRRKEDVLIELKDLTGPTTLVLTYSKDLMVLSRIPNSAIEHAKELTKFYSTKARNKKQIEYYVS